MKLGFLLTGLSVAQMSDLVTTFQEVLSFKAPLTSDKFDHWGSEGSTVFYPNRILLTPEAKDQVGYLESHYVSCNGANFGRHSSLILGKPSSKSKFQTRSATNTLLATSTCTSWLWRTPTSARGCTQMDFTQNLKVSTSRLWRTLSGPPQTPQTLRRSKWEPMQCKLGSRREETLWTTCEQTVSLTLVDLM